MYYLTLYTTLFLIYHHIPILDNISKYIFAHIFMKIILVIYTFPIFLEILENPIQTNMYQYIPYELSSLISVFSNYNLCIDECRNDMNALYYYFFGIYIIFMPVNKFLLAKIFMLIVLEELSLIKHQCLQKPIKKINKYTNFFTTLLILSIYINFKNKIYPSFNDIITLMILLH